MWPEDDDAIVFSGPEVPKLLGLRIFYTLTTTEDAKDDILLM